MVELRVVTTHLNVDLQQISETASHLRRSRSALAKILAPLKSSVIPAQPEPREGSETNGAPGSSQVHNEGRDVARLAVVEVAGPDVGSVAERVDESDSRSPLDGWLGQSPGDPGENDNSS